MRMPPLAGSWGTEQFGLVDVGVIKALEALEGAEKCAIYSFVEQRGSWAAESKRLEKEVDAHSKHKQRVWPSHLFVTFSFQRADLLQYLVEKVSSYMHILENGKPGRWSTSAVLSLSHLPAKHTLLWTPTRYQITRYHSRLKHV